MLGAGGECGESRDGAVAGDVDGLCIVGPTGTTGCATGGNKSYWRMYAINN